MAKTIPCPKCSALIGEGHSTVGMHPDFPYVCEDCDVSEVEHDEYGFEDEYED